MRRVVLCCIPGPFYNSLRWCCLARVHGAQARGHHSGQARGHHSGQAHVVPV